MDCLVSVIVPVHNTVEYLPRCIDSIRNQSLKDIEIILVENQSNDGSAALCDEYMSFDSRVKVLHLPVANASIARNAGLDIASAPYVGFVDSDDYIDYNMYEELFDVIKCHDVDIVYSNFQTEYLDGRIEGCGKNSGQIYIRSSLDVLRDMMWDKLNCSSCTKLFKRTVFSEYKFPENNIYEDWIIYILKGIEETSKNTIELIKLIQGEMGSYKEEFMTKLPKIYSDELLDSLFFEVYTNISSLDK